MPDDERRARLLRLLSSVEQLLAEAESITADAVDDETLSRAFNQLAESREALRHVEDVLSRTNDEK